MYKKIERFINTMSKKKITLLTEKLENNSLTKDGVLPGALLSKYQEESLELKISMSSLIKDLTDKISEHTKSLEANLLEKKAKLLEEEYPGINISEIKFIDNDFKISIIGPAISNDELLQFIDGTLSNEKSIGIISELKTNSKLNKAYNEFFNVKTLLAEAYSTEVNKPLSEKTEAILKFAEFVEEEVNNELRIKEESEKIKSEYFSKKKIKKNLFERLNIKMLIPTAAILGGLAAPILAPTFTMQMAMRGNEIRGNETQVAQLNTEVFEMEEEFLIRGSENKSLLQKNIIEFSVNLDTQSSEIEQESSAGGNKKIFSLKPGVEYLLRYKNSDGFVITILLEKITQKNESCLKIKYDSKENIICGDNIKPFLLNQKN